MKPASRKVAAALVVLLFAFSGSIAVLLTMMPASQEPPADNGPLGGYYLNYQGAPSRIFLVSASSLYTTADRSYLSSDGNEVGKGSQLFVVHLSLRNDYSSDAPAPAVGEGPVAPVDGTAYLCLNFTLNTAQNEATSVNVTPSDFSTSSSDKTGLVLASGQTYQGDFYLATNQTDITQFKVNLAFLGDAIPN